MIMRRSAIPALSIALTSLLISSGAVFAEDSEKGSASSTKPLTIEEMRAHRNTVRNDLMLPSLRGIRGLAFGIAGSYPEDLELHKSMENRLTQLSIPIKKIEDLEPGVTKPVDGVLQLKCLRAGSRSVLVELSLVQWVTLDRDPKNSVRACTYTDQMVCGRGHVQTTAARLLDQFVIDFQRANSVSNQPQATTPVKEASDEPSKKKKKS